MVKKKALRFVRMSGDSNQINVLHPCSISSRARNADENVTSSLPSWSLADRPGPISTPLPGLSTTSRQHDRTRFLERCSAGLIASYAAVRQQTTNNLTPD